MKTLFTVTIVTGGIKWVNVRLRETNAAFTCYRNYHKYEFPRRKLHVNGLSSRIYYSGKFGKNVDTRVS